MQAPRISWDIGTAYDLFTSLDVLHNPVQHGLRAAWAAGMRSRLPTAEREVLEQINKSICKTPIEWVYNLPAPKDSETALQAIEQLPPAERLLTLSQDKYMSPGIMDLLRGVITRRAWTQEERDALREMFAECWGKEHLPSIKGVEERLDLWANAEELGETFLGALWSYYDGFFAEEEKRIRPALEEGLQHARELAKTLEFSALLEELSQGVRYTKPPEAAEVTLIPSFWVSPWIYFGDPSEDQMIILFGTRPSNASLVPGEVVPDALINALKALADPTRLKILRYLLEESLTPTQLSRRLRLRAPTVVHHLNILRNAGLVYVLLTEAHKKDKEYQARVSGIHATWDILCEFLECSEIEEIENEERDML